MKTVAALSTILALANAHATWQQLWKNGEDLESTCARLPPSNSPIEDYTSTALQCNVNPAAASGKCGFEAGDTVTIEMHQHNTRLCTEEGIGGAHWGPVLAYMSKVEDAATADGSSEFFKVYQNTWKKDASAAQGDADFWGTKDLNYNCGKLDFKIPSDIAPGDYLLRAEAIALHAASASGGAQHYVTCYQLTVTGSGTLEPKGVTFPEAYTKTGPGLGFSIHADLASYPAPGPELIASGTEATPQLLTFGTITGAPAVTAKPAASSAPAATVASSAAAPASSSAVVEAVSSAVVAAPSAVAPVLSSAAAAAPSSLVAVPTNATSTAPVAAPSAAAPSAVKPTSAAKPTTTAAPVASSKPSAAPAIPSTLSTVVRPRPSGTTGSVTIAQYYQCGGTDFSGTGSCAAGLICKEWNPYYHQCVKDDGSVAAPTATTAAAVSATPAAEPTTVTPVEVGEKTYTLETFIAFLEKEAGSASAAKIRRMIEALQM